MITRAAANTRFVIPPGARDHAVTGTYLVREPGTILNFFPHMHVRGKDFEYKAIYPDGKEEILKAVMIDVIRFNTERMRKAVDEAAVFVGFDD